MNAIFRNLTEGKNLVFYAPPSVDFTATLDGIRLPGPRHIYYGVRTPEGVRVWVLTWKAEAYLLPLRLDVRDHSPTGFEWGYGGSGPAQLALAILADVFPAEVALDFYQDFKDEVIARLPHGHWALAEDRVLEWVNARPRKGGQAQ
jgi:hypothetical protein